MGYEVHITRAENWWENIGSEISIQEWLNYINNHPELISDSESGDCFVMWVETNNSPAVWLDWFGGNIYTKNPNKTTLQKMLQIAQELNAKVQGDEGELYDANAINHFDDWSREKSISSQVSKSRNFAKLLFISLAFILAPFSLFIFWLIIEIYSK